MNDSTNKSDINKNAQINEISQTSNEGNGDNTNLLANILSAVISIALSAFILAIMAFMLFSQGNTLIEQKFSIDNDQLPGQPVVTQPPDDDPIPPKEDIHSIVLKYNKLFQNSIITDWKSSNLTDSSFEKGMSISNNDSSEHKINWEEVKADGIDYVIIKIGSRGYTKGDIFLDKSFTEHMEGAKKNEIKIGCFFYSQAITLEEVDEEIETVINAVAPYKDLLSYPIGISLERQERTAKLLNEDLIDLIKYFCIRLTQSGYTPMIMGDVEWFSQFEEGSFKGYLKLVSSEEPPSNNIDNCIIWEYEEKSEIGVIKGTNSSLELSISQYGLLE